MDAKVEWLYYAPLSGRSLYRIRVTDLNDEGLSNAQLSAKVERYSDKPNNGGLSIDFAGNIYLTAVETKSIGVITPDRKYRTLTSDAEMVWPTVFHIRRTATCTSRRRRFPLPPCSTAVRPRTRRRT
jgi:sugar lactone lactonase YvrE